MAVIVSVSPLVMEKPCSFCGFPRGIAGYRLRCGCGTVYCGRLCQKLDYQQHREGCRADTLNRVVQELPLPRQVHRVVLQFFDPRWEIHSRRIEIPTPTTFGYHHSAFPYQPVHPTTLPPTVSNTIGTGTWWLLMQGGTTCAHKQVH